MGRHQCDCGVHCAKSNSVVAQVACTSWGLGGSSEGPWGEFFSRHQCDCGVHCASSSVVAQVACTSWGLVGSSVGPWREICTSWGLGGSSEWPGVVSFVISVDEGDVNSLVCGIGSIGGVALESIDVWIASGGCDSLCVAVVIDLTVVVVGVRDWKVCG
jgi:hypothetical protein